MLALAACAAALVIRGKNPQGALLLSVAVCIVLAVQILPALAAVYDYCKTLVSLTGISAGLFVPLLKVTVLAVCVRITAELCRDSGERAIASKIEIAGAAAGMLCALPLIEQALRLIGGLK